MKIVIPMAGTGDRFVRKGYVDPKPLIKVNEKMIIEYVIDMFDAKKDDFVFICNEKHLKETKMESVLSSLVSSYKLLAIPCHKKGPVFTMMGANDLLNDEEEVIVSYCDNPYLWDYNNFKSWVKTNQSDGCILSHTKFHPHRLSPTKMAYMKTVAEKEKYTVTAIKEKECYTEDHMTEHASTGTYYFGKGKYIKKYFQEAIDLDINYNGEYYVTLVYNLMIRDGLNVHSYLTDYVTVFGTPEEVENFEAWQTILRGVQVQNEDDLVACYKYWKKYNEESKKGNQTLSQSV